MKNNLKQIRKASLLLAGANEASRNKFLRLLTLEVKKNKKKILEANATDMARARAGTLSSAFIERLHLDEKGLEHIVEKLRGVEKLQSGLGEVIEQRKGFKGLLFKKVRTPLGVLMIIYEARPEVTIDVVALGIKSGNAVIVKGGSEALSTNRALYECIRTALKKSHLPEDSVHFIATSDRRVTNDFLKQNDFIDLVIARGGYKMVKAVMSASTIPVLAHAAGGARIYVDKSADLHSAEKILVNAKITKPSACNSLDTIVVHKGIAKKFVPKIVEVMERVGVTVLGDAESKEYAKVKSAVSADWDTEFLALTVAIKIVKDAEEAGQFVNEYSKQHSEGIIAKNKKVVREFVNSIDAAAVFINCSPRLHDGYVFGLGSEMGISTGKLHARGPVGLKELTTYKWEVYGKGQIR
ncbi:MAG: glutamate-5-semialdehyde dehydrogenase [Parcubacteria group bacterium Greene0714_7]|nr:MAG: glutamate-5-semialdehyde dehydrogenase [Parcubacteria group bacterium Greene0714_7]